MEKDWWDKEESKGYYVLEVKKHGELIKKDGENALKGRRTNDSCLTT